MYIHKKKIYYTLPPPYFLFLSNNDLIELCLHLWVYHLRFLRNLIFSLKKSLSSKNIQ